MHKKANAIFDPSDFYLSKSERAMIDAVKSVFAKVIVLMNVGGMVDVSWIKSDDQINAAMLTWQAGIEGGLAAAEILFGIANPSGKLCDTFAKDLTDYPYTQSFHDSIDYVEYTEDIFVGYRFFETFEEAKKKVIYPFGYGLSYSDYDINPVSVVESDSKLLFTVNVKNAGAVAGKEVVMLYYGAPMGMLGKPAKELGAFKKTDCLAPSENQNIELTMKISDMAF